MSAGKLRLHSRPPAGDMDGLRLRRDIAARPNLPLPSLRAPLGRQMRSHVVPPPPDAPTGVRQPSDAVEFDCGAPSPNTTDTLPSLPVIVLLRASGERDAT